MSLAVVHSRARVGLDAPPVTVEVHLGGGLPHLFIVGLPETAVRESKDRVRGALANAGFDWPAGRTTVNLAPADLPKDGGRFDLAIAIGILAASGQVPADDLDRVELIGELALTGALRPVGGTLPASLATRAAGRILLLPSPDAPEAALVRDADVRPATDLLAVCAHLRGTVRLAPIAARPAAARAPEPDDLADVRGQHQAKRALEIAAAGGHNLLYIGPPGTGKTMLATRLPGLLPEMCEQEALETAMVRSVSQLGFDAAEWGRRPFRAPHHTASAAALVGGGSRPRPGEISLAHNGVLFLDELPEFDRRVLEALREPLESGRVTVSRAARQAEFPARFQLVASMNPCPCGHLGADPARCRCTPENVLRYRGRVSGPLLDRIDLHVEVPRPSTAEMSQVNPGAPASAEVRARVVRAREIQLARAGSANAHLSPRAVEAACRVGRDGERLLAVAVQRFGLSARARHRILRVARTVADLAGAGTVTPEHLAEALALRCLDRIDTGVA